MKPLDTSALEEISRFHRWVGTKAMSYSWHEFIGVMWPVLFPLWTVGILIFLAVDNASTDNQSGAVNGVIIGLFWTAILAPIIFITLERYLDKKECQEAFQRFVRDNHLHKSDENGFRVELDNMLVGTLTRIEKSVGDRGLSFYTAVTVDLGQPVPEIVLDARQNNRWLSSLPNYYGPSQHLKLEGDFNEYFQLYGPEAWKIEVLSIITPDVMEALVTSGFKFDLEIVGGIGARLIISTPGYIAYNPEKLTALYAAFQAVFPEIKHKLRTLNIQTDNPKSLLLKKQAATYALIVSGHPIRFFRTLVYVWLTIGLVLAIPYVFGYRNYIEDIGRIYLVSSAVATYAYFRLKEK